MLLIKNFEKVFSPKRYQDIIFSYKYFITSFSLFMLWMFNQILEIDIIKSFGFLTNDGLCLINQKFLRPHCFGDFTLFVSFFDEGKNLLTYTYSPNIRIIYQLLTKLINFTNIDFILIMFFSTFIFTLFVSYNFLNRISKINIIFYLGLLFSSAPLLLALERGNSIIFSIIVISYLLIGIKNNNIKIILLGSFLLINLKIQFILILIPIILLYGIKRFLQLIFFVITTNLFSIILLEDGIKSYFDKVIRGLQILVISQDPNAEWPLNMSFSHSINRILLKLNIIKLEQISFTHYFVIIFLIIVTIFLTNKLAELKENHLLIWFLWIIVIMQTNPLLPLYNLIMLLPFILLFEQIFSKNNLILKTRILTIFLHFLFILNVSLIPIFTIGDLNRIIYIENSKALLLNNSYLFLFTFIYFVVFSAYIVHNNSKLQKSYQFKN